MIILNYKSRFRDSIFIHMGFISRGGGFEKQEFNDTKAFDTLGS
jgi:hypothetical protein